MKNVVSQVNGKLFSTRRPSAGLLAAFSRFPRAGRRHPFSSMDEEIL